MRRITKAKVRFLSLVPKGANQMPTMFKEDTGEVEFSLLVKGDEGFEKGELTVVVYAPEIRDSQGDIADAQVIKDMMYDAAKEGLDIDIRHDNKPVPRDKAFIAESFIVQKGDSRFADYKDYSGKPVDVTGSWAAIIKIDDPELRAKYRNGDWNGVSMGGYMTVKQEKADTSAGILKALASLLGITHKSATSTDGDIEMTEAQLTAALEASNTKLVTALKELLTPKEKTPEQIAAEKAAEDKTPKAPEFKGDPTKKEDVAKHVEALKQFNATKDLDWSDPVAVAKYQESLKDNGEDGDAEAGIEKEDTDEVKTLKRQLAKAQKVSGQPNTDNKTQTSDCGLSKEQSDAAAIGRKMAQAVNKQRGFAA